MHLQNPQPQLPQALSDALVKNSLEVVWLTYICFLHNTLEMLHVLQARRWVYLPEDSNRTIPSGYLPLVSGFQRVRASKLHVPGLPFIISFT